MAKLKGSPETGGRKRGTPNKTTALLKDAILQAAEGAGGKDGMIGYLRTQAVENPGPFMTLLGKVMPHQIAVRAGEGPLHAAEGHDPSIVRDLEWSHTRKTVLRRLRNDGHDFDVVLLVFEMNQHRVVSAFQEQVHGNFSATKAPN